jgi:ureidoacrylate peracid hydrolase
MVHPSHTALIVVDAQEVFCSSDSPLVERDGVDMTRIQAAVPRLNDFILRCRQAKVPVIWTRQVLSEDHMLPNQKALLYDDQGIWYDKLGTPETNFYSEMVPPTDGESVITKYSYDGFQDTDLHVSLQSVGIKTLLMTGFFSHVCVETTARHGFLLGHHIVAVSDCADSGTEREHESAMANIRNFFGKVATSAEISGIWESQQT